MNVHFVDWTIEKSTEHDKECHLLSITARDREPSSLEPYQYQFRCWFDEELGRWKSSLGTDSSTVIHVFEGSDDPEAFQRARSYTVQRFVDSARAQLNSALAAMRTTEEWP